ncbi:double zinc ribbon and ankyrin repeat-containing protein 1 [Brachionichthys hirsutus]|uniref:double zinc ribbon and ankyrin repeat-containing protein 1 n=1 Tax=Brachionichthys hirsutus TaxID=412623 RepID=UPI0036046847
MTAGAVSAPHIIPIMHLEKHRAKNLDTATRVSIQSDTPGVLVFYTVDGSRPVGEGRGSAGGRKYSQPILLPAGRVVVKAMAITSDGRESAVVTKVFSVEQVDADRKERQQQSSGVLKQLDSTQTEINLLRCPRCLSSRPSEPFAQFCPHCGAAVPPLPEQRPPPAEGGQVTCCGFCGAPVPVNSQSCLVCEAPVRRRPQSSLTPQGHRLCVCCGSGNPTHITRCLTCESRLQQVRPTQAGNSAPPFPLADGGMPSCTRCGRTNRRDARYCGWCASKLCRAAGCEICWQCGASGQPCAFYCGACGVFLQSQAPPKSYNDITAPDEHLSTNQVSCRTQGKQDDLYLCEQPSQDKMRLTTPTADKNTQTAGLYYPSAPELEKKEQQRALQISKQRAVRDRQLPPTAISPGRGYWRKQLDHVCAHLRSYVQNNAPFRALLGEPRLGRVVSAVMQEDLHEVTLTVGFKSAGQEVKPDGAGPTAGGPEDLSSVTEGSADSSGPRSSRSTGVTKTSWTPKPPAKNVQLLEELGPGRGQIAVIQQLLDQGADPTCCSDDGRHALVVAVVNGHHAALPVLVQRGADVNQQSAGRNSALHEAAALGSEGLQCAQVLLRCRASGRCRNAGGQTAYDVAVESGCSDLVALLAARTGRDLLGRVGGANGKPGGF